MTLSLPNDVGLIDNLYRGWPHLVGTYVLRGDEPALIDPGPASTLANLENGLTQYGLAFHDIRALLLTHIHLDHAGATGTLVARYPHLRVYVHQRGAPHLIAPERLIQSAARLYGDAMEQLWGEIRPVAEDNLIPVAGDAVILLGHRGLHAYDTPGHASQHLAYIDQDTGAAFVGDVAGVRLPGMSYPQPATPPPEIDLEAWQASLDTLRALAPPVLLLSHFGPVSEPAEHIEDFRSRLLRWAETVREGLANEEDETTQMARLSALAKSELGGSTGVNSVEHFEQICPVKLSWQGLARYWRRRAARARG
jgi:glyoxylase-like metal-dependent hydrolase (beta-lactamase superfamily II)